jgi:hypothetical protein
MADICPFTNAAKQFVESIGLLNCGLWVGGFTDNMNCVFVSQPTPYSQQTFKIG